MTKIHQYSRDKPCYFCGSSPPNNKEHIPPKMLFKNFKHSSITVPSCELHNNEKHGLDQGFITSLKLSLRQLIDHGIGKRTIPEEVQSTIQHAEYDQLARVGEFREIIVDAPDRLDFPLPYINLKVDIDNWIRQISAGLIWSKIGEFKPAIKWESSIVSSPNLIQSSGPLSRENALKIAYKSKKIIEKCESIEWKLGWYQEPYGYPKNIYNYSVFSFFDNNDKKNVKYIMKHEFYKNLIWFIFIDIPINIAEELN